MYDKTTPYAKTTPNPKPDLKASRPDNYPKAKTKDPSADPKLQTKPGHTEANYCAKHLVCMSNKERKKEAGRRGEFIGIPRCASGR